jgi:POT family proton-dependent oligopeptide transporter
MTWFPSLNPLLVIMMTPVLLAHWRRRAQAGFAGSAMRKMALGALIVGAAYLLLAAVAFTAGTGRASWLWLALFFAVFTLGELYILPTGLGLFARLAPIGYGATTVAAWFLVISSGSLSAGIVGTLWGRISHAGFFAILTVIAAIAAAMLLSLDGAVRRIEAARAAETIALNAIQPETA